MTLEIQKTANIFEVILDEAKKSKGKETQIVTFANDTFGEKKIYSHLGVLGEGKLNQALTEFVQGLVPEGESRKTLEEGFNEDPDHVVHYSHYDEIISELCTIDDNLIIGIKAIRDQRGESVRTWYLKSI